MSGNGQRYLNKKAIFPTVKNGFNLFLIFLSVLPVPYLVPILFSLIIIIGAIGNILVVLVVALNKTMRNNTNILILNLAVSRGRKEAIEILE